MSGYANTSGIKGSKFITLTMAYPDFAGFKIPAKVIKEALKAAADIILVHILPQVPIDTGQLRRAYTWRISEMLIRAADTKRIGKGAHLTNLELSYILAHNGHLSVTVSQAVMRKATKAFHRVLMKYAGRKKELRSFFTRTRLIIKTRG